MLDINALEQLKSLKQGLHESIPRFTGRVRSTGGRFGFVNTDCGKQYFLAPDEMDKVLPGDTITFRVEPASNDKEQAIIESLVNSPQDSFVARYVVRGKGHFLEPDHPTLNRWIFVPPAQRQGAVANDFVRAHISQHPYPSGKAQGAIDEIIGTINDTMIEHRVIQQKFGLNDMISEAVQQQVSHVLEHPSNEEWQQRSDLTHLPFVTIDSASTRDIDDALYVEAHSQGWSLWIAIADPAAFIAPNSALDDTAKQRATSVYFPQYVMPMLPPELSEQRCSLVAHEERLAMVVELKISEQGSIEHTQIHSARITSHAKLNYNQVAQLIEGNDNDVPAELQGHVLHLHHCARALANFRQTHCLVMEDRPDYKLLFDEQGKVRDILRVERNDAHRLVEECMLACNRSVALWLAARNSGLFIGHAGIRSERLGEASSLLREVLQLERKPKLQTLNEFVQLLQDAEQVDQPLPIRMIISRQLERSQITTVAQPHFGLGFDLYTTFTSPLRKYNDLLVHRMVKSLLNNEHVDRPHESLLQHIQTQQANARHAALQTEQWLKLQWLQQQAADTVYHASIVHMNSGSITVRLNDNGIEGSIDRRKVEGNWVFDSKTITHTSDDVRYVLGQSVTVTIKQIEPQQRAVQFTLL